MYQTDATISRVPFADLDSGRSRPLQMWNLDLNTQADSLQLDSPEALESGRASRTEPERGAGPFSVQS